MFCALPLQSKVASHVFGALFFLSVLLFCTCPYQWILFCCSRHILNLAAVISALIFHHSRTLKLLGASWPIQALKHHEIKDPKLFSFNLLLYWVVIWATDSGFPPTAITVRNFVLLVDKSWLGLESNSTASGLVIEPLWWTQWWI